MGGIRVRNLFLIITLCGLAAAKVDALSCVQPDIVDSYQYSTHSKNSVVILKGEFSFPQLFWKKSEKIPKTQIIQGTFLGLMLDKHGFKIPYSEPVILIFECFSAWCGDMQPDQNVIAFVDVEDRQLTLRVQPCNSKVFSMATLENELRLLSCHHAGECR
tara:strand:- start:1698 stop:2177 length:480 start_codon:yes stop_codon:yes gene_type:complete